MTTENDTIVGGNLGVGITPTSKLHVSGNTTITNNCTVGGTLGVTGATTLSSSTTTGNAVINGTLGVTGATTLTSSNTTGNAVVGGTLNVTGATTMSSSNTTGNAVVGGTLNVTGTTTLSNSTTTGNATINGTTTMSNSSTTGDATITGTLGVTGATTLSTATISGNVTVGGQLTTTGNLGVGINTPNCRVHAVSADTSQFPVVARFLAPQSSPAPQSPRVTLGYNDTDSVGFVYSRTGTSNAANFFAIGHAGVSDTQLVVRRDGNIGIGGVSNPTSRLQVSGTTAITGNTSITGTASINGNTTITGFAQVNGDIAATNSITTLSLNSEQISNTGDAQINKVIVGFNGDIFSGITGVKGRSVLGSEPHFVLGQSDSNNAYQVWRFNATLASAFLDFSTLGGANPICMQTSGGRVSIGRPTQTLGTDTIYGNLHLATAASPNSNNVVIEAGALSNGTFVGQSSLNFNGYSTSAGNQRINTSKNRWRLFCDQNGSSDYMQIDTFNGSTNTTLMRFNTNGSIQYPSLTNLSINTSTGPFGRLQLASGNNVNNVVIEAGTTSDGSNSGWSAINFNGYFSGSEQRINGSKNRWRIMCDQRSTTDRMAVHKFDGTTGTEILSFENSNNVRVTRQPVIQRRVTVYSASATYTLSDIVDNGIIHHSGLLGFAGTMPSLATFTNAGYQQSDTFNLIVVNTSSNVLSLVTSGTYYGTPLVGANGIGNMLLVLTASAVDLYRLNN